MKINLLLLLVTFIPISCMNRPSETGSIPVKLGDTDAVVKREMRAIGAEDVTANIVYTGYAAVTGEQKYYWWWLSKRQMIVGILLNGMTIADLRVIKVKELSPGLESQLMFKKPVDTNEPNRVAGVN